MKFTVFILLLICTVTIMEARKHGREKHHRRVRACQCTLTYFYRPVCGTNRRTYDNENTLACHNMCNPDRPDVAIAHLGRCSDRSRDHFHDDSDEDSSSSSESIETNDPNKFLTIQVGRRERI